MERHTDVVIIGTGTAGLSALSQVRRAGKAAIMINGGFLGTTCARVGCMPSKAFIQPADDLARRTIFAAEGIVNGDALEVNIPQLMKHVRELRDGFTAGIIKRTQDLGENLITGYARFTDNSTVEVDDGTIVHADAVVVATGSSPLVPTQWQENFPELLLTTDNFFEQEDLPSSIGVIGLGPVGLEIGQAFFRLGLDVVGVDRLETIGGLADPYVNRVATETLCEECDIWLGADAKLSKTAEGRLEVRTEDKAKTVDKVFVAMGRPPNVQNLNLKAVGVELDEKGMPSIDQQTMQVEHAPVFFAGDVTGQRPVLHEASHEGSIAGYNAARWPARPLRFKRKAPLAITFCEPNIAQVGKRWDEVADDNDVAVGEYDFRKQSRAEIMGANTGLLRVYGRKSDGLILGAAMCIPRGENIAHFLVQAVQSERSVSDLLGTPFYHPVLEEGLESALEDLAGKTGEAAQ